MERLQKILASAGHGSRRQCEQYIRQERVEVNGEVAELGQKADSIQDEIRLDGKPIGKPEASRYLLLYKPRDVLSSLESQGGHPTVDDLIDVPQRIYPVGRLDLDSEGLLLLTNDGDLTHRLTHPSFEHEKEYRVLLDREPTTEQLQAWRRGVELPELGPTARAKVSREADAEPWVRVVMHEGMNRQIREIASYLGLAVVRLIRVRMATVRLGDLQPGEWRPMKREEIGVLREATALPPGEPAGQRELG